MQPPNDPDFKGLKSARKWAKALKDFFVAQSVTSINGRLPESAGPTGKIFKLQTIKVRVCVEADPPTTPATYVTKVVDVLIAAPAAQE